MNTLRPTVIIVAAFLAGAALAEVGIRVTGAYQRDATASQPTRAAGHHALPVNPARSVEPAPRRACPRVAI